MEVPTTLEALTAWAHTAPEALTAWALTAVPVPVAVARTVEARTVEAATEVEDISEVAAKPTAPGHAPRRWSFSESRSLICHNILPGWPC